MRLDSEKQLLLLETVHGHGHASVSQLVGHDGVHAVTLILHAIRSSRWRVVVVICRSQSVYQPRLLRIQLVEFPQYSRRKSINLETSIVCDITCVLVNERHSRLLNHRDCLILHVDCLCGKLRSGFL